MKADFFHILLERSRNGGTHNRKGRHASWKDAPKKASMKSDKSDRKSLNENLKPLERYLESQVGRSWNKIYSEIRRNLNANSAVQLHVLQHIPDYVNLHCIYNKEDKKYYSKPKYGSYGEVRGLYVDNNGILRKAPKYKYKYKRYSPEQNMLNELVSLFGTTKHGYTIIDNKLYRTFEKTNSMDIATLANAKIDFKSQKQNGYYGGFTTAFDRQVGVFLQKYRIIINKLENREYFTYMWGQCEKSEKK